MKVTTNYQTAKEHIAKFEPIFFTHFSGALYKNTEHRGSEQHLSGRKYRGLFDENDGSYVTLTKEAKSGEVIIDRDSYGSIPLFYSTDHPVVSTDLTLLINICGSDFNSDALAEYLSASYLTAGKTIYKNIRCLMPNETIVVHENILKVQFKNIFLQESIQSELEVSALLERAIDNSINNLLAMFPGTLALNLSGGTDSTLLLAKIRTQEPHKKIVTSTYFHDDWRDDIDDWKYADHASKQFGSQHQLIRVDNETFCQSHRELLRGTYNVYHTYAAAFYAQNKVSGGTDDGVPILNGSGPDESIIGTEKISIHDLLSLRMLGRDRWIKYLIANVDYIKLPETTVMKMLRGGTTGFVQSRMNIAETLMGSSNFVEFQRRYHVATILQDHIQELSSVARLLNRPILFPYLTNDIFRIIFSTSFEVLNSNEVYKSVVKKMLERSMPKDFVYRHKIGFQSPSRPYFKSGKGLGRELSKLLSNGRSSCLNLDLVAPSIRDRLNADIDFHRRYDFLEWTVYNILLLEHYRGTCA
jgi:asparagine synthetase B (glutamine-hydrolysing)